MFLGPFLRAFLPAGGGPSRRRDWRLFGPLHFCPGVATGPRAGALGIGPESRRAPPPAPGNRGPQQPPVCQLPPDRAGRRAL